MDKEDFEKELRILMDKTKNLDVFTIREIVEKVFGW